MSVHSNDDHGVLVKGHPTHGPSFSLANRALRILWLFVYYLFFKPTPPPFHPWRCFLLSCFGSSLGRDCLVYSDVKIWAPWNLRMGDESSLGRGVNCYCMGPVSLGRRARVSQGSFLCTGSHDYDSKVFQLFVKPIFVGDDAWVCAEAFIAPGVSIGEGTVVGARSVVTRSLPSWTVCAGNPCRPRKFRTRPY